MADVCQFLVSPVSVGSIWTALSIFNSATGGTFHGVQCGHRFPFSITTPVSFLAVELFRPCACGFNVGENLSTFVEKVSPVRVVSKVAVKGIIVSDNDNAGRVKSSGVIV
jgi:hypothetical protein